MKIIFFLLSSLIIFLSSGCLVFNTISYDVKLNKDKSGTVSLFVNDIKSNAENDSDFESDKKNLFDYMFKSGEFVSAMKKDAGKNIIERNLSIENGKLNGTAVYEFENIIGIENIQYQDGFYYLNLSLEDSIISTNGEIVKSNEFKRIIWDDKMKNLKFEMFSLDLNNASYKELAPYYKKQ